MSVIKEISEQQLISLRCSLIVLQAGGAHTWMEYDGGGTLEHTHTHIYTPSISLSSLMFFLILGCNQDLIRP
ncbi:hypothetical protein BX600DRAFT_456247 [Xylariales sp. PMI_506]|nr:hypothetical protein BX600DRAFT_456247 [Xylariales sp. PMI_506]